MINERLSIKSFWSIFDEDVWVDGKPIPKPKMNYDEKFLRHFCPWLFQP